MEHTSRIFGVCVLDSIRRKGKGRDEERQYLETMIGKFENLCGLLANRF